MSTESNWHEETMARYEDGEAALLEAQRRSYYYWSDLDTLKTALQDTVITDKTIRALLIMRQLVSAHPGALAGAAMLVLEQFENVVVEHILENGEIDL